MSAPTWDTVTEGLQAAGRVSGLTDQSLRHQRYWVGQFAAPAPDDPTAVTAADVERFFDLPRCASPSTRRAVRKALRQLFAWMTANGLLEESPLALYDGGAETRELGAVWRDVIGEFMDYETERGLAEGTLKHRRYYLRQFAHLCAANSTR